MAEITLKRVRLSFPDLWRPGKPGKDGKPGKFGGQFIFEKDDENHQKVKAAMTEVAKAVYGENWAAIVGAMEKSKKCLRDGNTNLDSSGRVRDGYKDKMFVVARNSGAPAIIDAKSHKPDGTWNYLTEASGRPYSGCIVNAKIDIQAMKAKGEISANIFASLLAVQYVSKGEAFGARPGTPEGFEDEEGDDAFSEGGAGSSGDDDDPFA